MGKGRDTQEIIIDKLDESYVLWEESKEKKH